MAVLVCALLSRHEPLAKEQQLEQGAREKGLTRDDVECAAVFADIPLGVHFVASGAWSRLCRLCEALLLLWSAVDCEVHSTCMPVCRGVVQLFNAITQAQRAKGQAEAAGSKASAALKETKAALFDALQPESKPAQHHANGEGGSAAARQPGWAVLQEGYTGHGANTKMKDLDRVAEEGAAPAAAAEQLRDLEGESDGDDDYAGW